MIFNSLTFLFFLSFQITARESEETVENSLGMNGALDEKGGEGNFSDLKAIFNGILEGKESGSLASTIWWCSPSFHTGPNGTGK
mgnify:CR=1 FL=1